MLTTITLLDRRQGARIIDGCACNLAGISHCIDTVVTHRTVIGAKMDKLGNIPRLFAGYMGNRSRVPRVISVAWIKESWRERLAVAEGRSIADRRRRSCNVHFPTLNIYQVGPRRMV